MTPTEGAEPPTTQATKEATDNSMTCYLIAIAARELDRAITTRLTPLGVTSGQLPTLLALYQQEGLTQADLARSTGVEQPTMAINLQRMERAGLIERRPNPNGGRKIFVYLTARARTIEDPIRALRADIDDDALAGIPQAAQEQLRQSLSDLIRNMQDLNG